MGSLIPPISIDSLSVNSVIKVTLKEPYSAVPASASNGDNWLTISRPRTPKSLYKSQFFAIVSNNFTVQKFIEVRVADFRQLSTGSSLSFFKLDLDYKYIKTAQFFQQPVGMAPETAIATIQQFQQQGHVSALGSVVFIPSAPILIPSQL